MRRLFVAACAAMLVCAASAEAHIHSSRAERYFAKRCSQRNAIACIHRAALHWEVSFSHMKGISWRESRWNPYAKNPSSTASGLFQFLTSTWANTPYGRYSIWSAKQNSLAAAWAMQRGYMSWWALTA